MITTVTLNPCIDKTLYLDGFTPGGLNRVARSRQDPCGKGINVSKVLAALGVETRCVGVNYLDNRQLLERELDTCDIPFRFAVVPGAVRTNVKLFDTRANQMTEVNEKGQLLEEAALRLVGQLVREAAPVSDWMVFSGSVPPGVPADFYRELMESCAPTPCALDTDGELFRQGLQAKPALVKPNRWELENYCGRPLRDRREVLAAARELLALGVRWVCVSLGEEGALLAHGREAWYAPVLPVEVRGLQGAGDSMVAGLCCARLQNAPAREMLVCAMAAAAGSVSQEGTLLCGKDEFARYYPLVQAERME